MGGRGGFKVLDENGHGGRGGLGEWMSTFQDLPKYNCPKSNIFEIKVELLPFMGCQGSVNGEKNVIWHIIIT